MKVFNTWWIICNSKIQFSNHKKDDGKPGFCRALADWIENWCNERVPSFEQFPFSLSTAKDLRRTLRCQASLIEDLFDDGYDFVLTARFQGDPLERHFVQYRQISGGLLLVGLKDTICSIKFLKIKISLDTLMLSRDSREVTVHIAGYTAKKYFKKN